MEQRYELMGASREERHRRMKRVTKMFHHAYFHWCEVVASAGQDRGGGGGCRVEVVVEGGTFKQSPHTHTHTHMHTRTHVQASAALILNTPLAIIIFI